MEHFPVLLDAVLEALRPCLRIVDGTLGAGGHSRALLEENPERTILGLDRDLSALEIARRTLAGFGERVHIIHASYLDMAVQARRLGWDQVDGILLDLGVSSMQFDRAERGFSFTHDGPLDMRFDPEGSESTAADLVNTLAENDLANLIYNFGEERHSRQIARAIVRARPLETTRQLAASIERAIPRGKRDRIHPATRTFQALRIAVNDELGAVESILPAAIDLLSPGGRLAVISFHSLEDRIVKQAFKLASSDCICPPKTPICICGHKASIKLITAKPIVAGETEIVHNPRSRSAKLRVVEKLS